MFLPAGRGTTLQSRSSLIIPLWERFLCTARRQISLFSKSPRRAIPFREVSLERVWSDSPPDGVVKSEYTANELCDFAYLPERQLYETGENTVIPHIDAFDKDNDLYLLLLLFPCRSSPYILPIRFSAYSAPYDINIRDSTNEKERSYSKFYIFVSSNEQSGCEVVP